MLNFPQNINEKKKADLSRKWLLKSHSSGPRGTNPQINDNFKFRFKAHNQIVRP